MKIRFVKCLAVAFAMLVGSTAMAQDYYEVSDTPCETVSYLGGGEGCQKACDDDCGKGGGYGKGILDGLGCGCGPTFYVDFDAMFLRYNRADGAQDVQNVAAPGTPNNGAYNFNFDFAPRLTLGVETANGTGLRIRYFDYSVAKTVSGAPPAPANRRAGVDTFNIDVEVFRNIDLACNTHMQWSIGARYNDFKEQITPVHPFFGAPYRNKFDGFGIVGGLEFTQDIRWGAIYGRCRGALLVDDREIGINGVEIAQNDVTVGMLELAVGWEASRCLNNGMVVTAGIGYEIQQWMNYGIATPLIVPVTTPVDVGFDGVVINFGVSY